MFSFLMGTEDDKWKWQCIHCHEVFYTEIGRAQDAEKHECKEAAQQSAQADVLLEPACCATFVAYGVHHEDCRNYQCPAQQSAQVDGTLPAPCPVCGRVDANHMFSRKHGRP